MVVHLGEGERRDLFLLHWLEGSFVIAIVKRGRKKKTVMREVEKEERDILNLCRNRTKKF